jgi:hypothetical protein
LVTLVALATVKKSAGTPLKVYPALTARVIVAVYAVLAANVAVTAGDQVTVPVYSVVSVTAVAGVPPVAGAVTPPIALVVTVVPAAPVAGNTAVTTLPPAALVTLVAPATVKKSAGTPLKVYPDSAVSVIVAVYAVLAANIVVTAGDQLTVPVYWAVAVIVVAGVPPVVGAVTPPIALVVTTASLPPPPPLSPHPATTSANPNATARQSVPVKNSFLFITVLLKNGSFMRRN